MVASLPFLGAIRHLRDQHPVARDTVKYRPEVALSRTVPDVHREPFALPGP